MKRISTLLARREPVVNILSPKQSVLDAVQVMASRQVAAVLIVQERRLVGMFTERDVVWRVLAEGRSPAETPIEKVMTREIVTTHPDEEFDVAVEKMRSVGCRHLPVLLEGHVADTLSMRDLLFAELSHRRDEVESLRSYIRGERHEGVE